MYYVGSSVVPVSLLSSCSKVVNVQVPLFVGTPAACSSASLNLVAAVAAVVVHLQAGDAVGVAVVATATECAVHDGLDHVDHEEAQAGEEGAKGEVGVGRQVAESCRGLKGLLNFNKRICIIGYIFNLELS